MQRLNFGNRTVELKIYFRVVHEILTRNRLWTTASFVAAVLNFGGPPWYREFRVLNT